MEVLEKRAEAMGVGSLKDVAIELGNLPHSESGLTAGISKFVDAVESISSRDGGRQILLALVASIQNEDFRKTGWLYWVDENGRFSREYISNDVTRTIFAKMAGL